MYNQINLLSKALNASWKRNEVIANNIANVNTPNFKRSDVEFEEILKRYVNGDDLTGVTTHQNHIPIGVRSIADAEHKVVNNGGFSTRRDKNNVDIDVEMAELAKNTITFNTLSTQLNNHFSRLRIAINEGKR
ncbi:flagellar basal body rod protein FlgB [Alkaliphilus hydrothermalis]|uniref:Flagellar basal body rod protein FlgB n=1 Tax=Alkaliphilus hydrothermalis TaxID=1482730 RepID=A0ABS2NL40_9FIRM|nr:flagellar basal body rod protein FlgB [Alkaliphilus hydrothermalis]MBM7613651.1 flagellar basal-body rod protein FlgB [Alkaliphilus hydrothermalis]